MTDPYTGPAKIRVIDYETTGTQEDAEAEVVEMGRIDFIVRSCTIENPWTSLCKPMDGIPPVTKAVHHIRDEDVDGAPPARELWPYMTDGMGEGDVFCAHNAPFEVHFSPPDFQQWKWIDTYKVALIAWPDAPGHSNQVLRYWFDIDALPDFDRSRAEPPHRALPDSYVTAFVLRKLLETKSIEEMIKISSYPAVLRRIRFGKHRGSLFSDVPADYLEWLLTSEMGEDVKFTAKRELQIRRKSK